MPFRPPVHRPAGWRSPEETRRAYEKSRPSPAERGYDSTWRKLRLEFLKAHPLCDFCHAGGRVTPAAVVDHILTIEARPDLRLEWNNLRSLCVRCHNTRSGHDLQTGKHR